MNTESEPKNKAKSRFSAPVYFIAVFLTILLLPKVLSFALGTPYPMASISSNSMWPVLRRGDLVLVQRATPETIKVGTVVVYQQGSSFVIHRVVAVNEDTVVAKGDANSSEDRPVHYDEVIGQVPVVWGRIVKIPYLGYITFLAKRPSP
ncbi:MAG: signal peptidase I [Candidatus Aquicultorales bacterium]